VGCTSRSKVNKNCMKIFGDTTGYGRLEDMGNYYVGGS
jgi:hypothetical protein